MLVERLMSCFELLDREQNLPFGEPQCLLQGGIQFCFCAVVASSQFGKWAGDRVWTPQEQTVLDFLGEIIETFSGAVGRLDGSGRTLPGVAFGYCLIALVEVIGLPPEHHGGEHGGEDEGGSPKSPVAALRECYGLLHLTPPGYEPPAIRDVISAVLRTAYQLIF